jgi:hypothetical protein
MKGFLAEGVFICERQQAKGLTQAWTEQRHGDSRA